MSEPWRWRGLMLAGAVALVELPLVIAGMGPRLLLVAALILVVASITWLAIDLGGAVEPAPWRRRTRSTIVAGGADLRTQLMRARLTNKRIDSHAIETLHASLVALLDDRLQAEHMVDRRIEPLAAHAIIGPELTRFVCDPPASSPLTEPRGLARIVTLIECV